MISRSQLRNLLIGAAVLGLLSLPVITVGLSDLTRASLATLLTVFLVPVVQAGEQLFVAGIHVPWQQDCSGLNLLLLLVATVCWAHNSESDVRRFVLKIGTALSAGFLANLLRVLTIIAYRQVWYPATESLELHYAFGFFWLAPFLLMFVPRSDGSLTERWLQMLVVSVMLCLLTPELGSRHGVLVAMSAVAVFARFRFENAAPAGFISHSFWMLAGVAIFFLRVDSLWLGWLLVCPHYSNYLQSFHVLRLGSWTVLLALSGTVSVVAMHPAALWIVGPAVLYELNRFVSGSVNENLPPVLDAPTTQPNCVPLPFASIRLASVLFGLTFPFTGGLNSLVTHPPEGPPAGVLRLTESTDSCTLRVIGQSPLLTTHWFVSTNGDRHHTLPVCMKFKGVSLTSTSQAHIHTDGKVWYRECYIQEGGLILDYASYLRHTCWPLASPGAHLIVTASCESVCVDAFAAESDRLFQRIDQLNQRRRSAMEHLAQRNQ